MQPSASPIRHRRQNGQNGETPKRGREPHPNPKILLLIGDAKLGAAGLSSIVLRGFVNLPRITQPRGGGAVMSAADERRHSRTVVAGGVEAEAAAVIPVVLLRLLLSPAV